VEEGFANLASSQAVAFAQADAHVPLGYATRRRGSVSLHRLRVDFTWHSIRLCDSTARSLLAAPQETTRSRSHLLIHQLCHLLSFAPLSVHYSNYLLARCFTTRLSIALRLKRPLSICGSGSYARRRRRALSGYYMWTPPRDLRSGSCFPQLLVSHSCTPMLALSLRTSRQTPLRDQLDQAVGARPPLLLPYAPVALPEVGCQAVGGVWGC
jgi:hypothetical protein